MFEAFWRWFLPHAVAWLALPLRTITREDGIPYLQLWYLCGEAGGLKYFPEGQTRMRWWQRALTWLPCLYVHRFVSSDSDPELHNHPWEATSWILVGGYVEERRVPRMQGGYKVIIQTFRPGMLNRLMADTFHRVTLIGDGDAWSIIRLGQKVQSWGFYNMETGIFLHHKEHAARKSMWKKTSTLRRSQTQRKAKRA